jgi:hypothetical protein
VDTPPPVNPIATLLRARSEEQLRAERVLREREGGALDRERENEALRATKAKYEGRQ